MVIFCLVLVAPRGTWQSVKLIKMNTYPAAFWSNDSSSSSDESRDRAPHYKRTKQRGNREQRLMGSWAWEEILDGKGPWRQAGEYRRPKELEAAKAERRRYVVSQRNRHERQPQNIFFGGVAHGEIGGVRRET